MKKVILKKVSIPVGGNADEKIQMLARHINELENNLELILNLMNSKISGEG